MITKIYAVLLRLYPRRFQAEFSDEMKSTFEEAVQTQSGRTPAFFLLLYELYDLPNNLLNAYAAERPQGWETAMKNRIIYTFVFLIMILGIWLSVSMYMGVINPGTFIALVTAVFLISIPASSILRRTNYKIWVSTGFVTLVLLFAPMTEFVEILVISMTMIIAALLINSNIQVRKRRDADAEDFGEIRDQSQKTRIASIVILVLIALLLAKAFHNFYWFIIWDSTTDSLDWLWLPIPVLAIIFSSFLLYFLLPDRTKPKGFLYLVTIPVLVSVFISAEQVDFRQLTNQRAEHVSQLIETYNARVGHYPDNLQELIPLYTLSISEPIIMHGQNWCYDGGATYYRLGYVYRLHWSDPRLIGKVHKSGGMLPELPGMCLEEITAIQERFPDYPYEYWADGE